jgi:lipopolysaccharide/colanic/teichoic acid biosynthesis glycosyltransferase
MGISLAVLFGLNIPFSRAVFGVSALSFLAFAVLNRVAIRRVTTAWFGPTTRAVAGVGFGSEDRKRLEQSIDDRVRWQWIDLDDLDPSFEALTDPRPDVVLVRTDDLSYDELRSLFDFGSRFQVPVRINPTSKDIFLSGTTVESWKGHRLLRSRTHHRFQQKMAVKSLFDWIGAGVLGLLLSPLILICSLAILVFDGWPVIYRQKRVGRGGDLFDMYKFRTMEEDAEAGPGITEGPDDPRITSVGRILRRWSLDELPQLVNILKGDMSLVGPRPEIPDITRDYSPEQKRVLWIKPGLTGLSQVSGRERLELDRKLEIDQLYLSEYSIGLDLWILFKTLIVVIRGEGAN